MTDRSKQARARGELLFPTHEKEKAVADYKIEAQAVRDRTARLKALRLAKEAADQRLAASSERPPKRRASSRGPAAQKQTKGM